MFHLFVFLCFTAVCRGQRLLSDVPTPTVDLVSGWPDVFPTERVEVRCSINGSANWTFSWFRDHSPVQADDLVSFNSDNSTLSISSALGSHEGRYQCRGRLSERSVETSTSTDVNLTVYSSQPTVRLTRHPDFPLMFSGEPLTLSCHVDVSRGWTHLWFHNNRLLDEKSSNLTIAVLRSADAGSYSCRAQRGRDQVFLTEQHPGVQLAVVEKKPKPWIAGQPDVDEAFVGEHLSLTCFVGKGSGWTYTWYKDGRQVKATANMLRFQDIRSSDSGAYVCAATREETGFSSEESNARVLQVSEISIPVLKHESQWSDVFLSESTTLRCQMRNASAWTYTWFIHDHEIGGKEDDTSLSRDGTMLTIRSVSPSHVGPYSCSAKLKNRSETSRTSGLKLHVHDVPTPTVDLVSGWPDVFPTERVEVRCSINGSANWTFSWFRDHSPVQADDLVSFNSDNSTLSISSALGSHEGRYQCRGRLSERSVETSTSTDVNLTVYSSQPTVRLTRHPDFPLMFSGEPLTLSCHVDVSRGWTHLWFHNNRLLDEKSSNLTIAVLRSADAGSYSCRAQRGRDQVFLTEQHPGVQLAVVEKKPKPWIAGQPDVDEAFVGEHLSLTCFVGKGSGWTYTWYKDGRQVKATANMLRFQDIRSSDSGEYVCAATREETGFSSEESNARVLQVSEISIPVLKHESQWSDVFLSESTTLRCQMRNASAWTYTWFIHDHEIGGKEDDTSLSRDGTMLTIRSVSPSHVGPYSCSAKLKNRSATSRTSGLKLHVHDRKPKVSLDQDPPGTVLHSGDSVSFRCHVNVSTGWRFQWFKDNVALDGSDSDLSFSSIKESHSGSYECRASRGQTSIFQLEPSQTATLSVHARPSAVVILSTSWLEVFSTDNLVLLCTVQDSGKQQWNYTWYREDEEIPQMLSSKHTVTQHDDPEQGEYKCKGVRTSRPTYSSMSKPLKTKNLLLKRRLLLSISGCLLFSLVAVLLGFIAYRVVRKPVREEAKVEEVDLFLTMDQLKERVGHAPCQLVDYIMDVDAPVKAAEMDQNGTSSPDTTLVTPAQEEPDVTVPLSPDEPEDELLSFRQ